MIMKNKLSKYKITLFSGREGYASNALGISLPPIQLIEIEAEEFNAIGGAISFKENGKLIAYFNNVLSVQRA